VAADTGLGVLVRADLGGVHGAGSYYPGGIDAAGAVRLDAAALPASAASARGDPRSERVSAWFLYWLDQGPWLLTRLVRAR
jgi:hypothetical protein